jgi:hypothetical protein
LTLHPVANQATERMTTLQNATVEQLRKLISIKEEIESLETQLGAITGGESAAPPIRRGRRKMSRAARAAIGAAPRRRWARIKGSGATASKSVKKGKRRLSAAGRAAIIAATKARWTKVKETTATSKATKKKDGRSSPKVRTKLAAAARARWAKVKAAGMTTL